MADFERGDLPIVFGLVIGDETYLINTEGYSYCRYIARVMQPARLP
jgi:hypothetical protein